MGNVGVSVLVPEVADVYDCIQDGVKVRRQSQPRGMDHELHTRGSNFKSSKRNTGSSVIVSLSYGGFSKIKT